MFSGVVSRTVDRENENINEGSLGTIYLCWKTENIYNYLVNIQGVPNWWYQSAELGYQVIKTGFFVFNF